MNDRSQALEMAVFAASRLYNVKIPLGTNLWCCSKVRRVEEEPPLYERQRVIKGDFKPLPYYVVVSRKRAPEIRIALDKYVASLVPRSVAAWIESDYLGKYFIPRNYYVPESLRQQAEICKWFLTGSQVILPIVRLMERWWESRIPPGYRVRSPESIPCPRYDASGGVCYVRSERGGFEWDYLKKGPNWGRIQSGTAEWLTLVEHEVPSEWLKKPVTHLIKAYAPGLEELAVEVPVIRPESGPDKVRWARSSSGNLYILGRMFVGMLQDDPRWVRSKQYIGLASNCLRFACKAPTLDVRSVGTHGDDWIAYCPRCERWLSGDLSNFDLHVSARLILAGKQALLDQINHLLSDRERKWFYALSYYSIRCPTLWLWDKKGEASCSVRRTLGKTRSGSGDFIMDNNCENWSVMTYVLDKAHQILHWKGRTKPCKSRMWWDTLSSVLLKTVGWVAKPSAQLSHPKGFVACRCIFDEEYGFLPSPCVSSVVRNWVNPSYDPAEYPGCSEPWMQTRFRDVVGVLARARSLDVEFSELLAETACNAGVPDPWGIGKDAAILSRQIGEEAKKYSLSAFLDSIQEVS